MLDQKDFALKPKIWASLLAETRTFSPVDDSLFVCSGDVTIPGAIVCVALRSEQTSNQGEISDVYPSTLQSDCPTSSHVIWKAVLFAVINASRFVESIVLFAMHAFYFFSLILILLPLGTYLILTCCCCHRQTEMSAQDLLIFKVGTWYIHPSMSCMGNMRSRAGIAHRETTLMCCSLLSSR